jgi:hypothetical protein
MDDFTIRPLVGADAVRIVESMSPSDGPPIVPALPADCVQPELSSFDRSDTAQSHELPWPDDYLDAPEDDTESLSGVENYAPEMVHSHPVDIPRNIDIIAGILQDAQLLRLNCLGDALPDINPFTDPVPLTTVLHRPLETCCEKCFLTSGLMSPFRSKSIFMHSLVETRILLARFLVLYRAYRHITIPESIPQDQMIREVIAPRLFNPSHTCCINAFVQVLFHIIPLKLMILAWPNSDQTVSKIRVLFASMSQHHVTNTVSLSTICKPDLHDAKNCSELALKILGTP